MAHAGGGGVGPAGRGLSGARWGRSGSGGHEKLPVHVSGAPAVPGEPRRPVPGGWRPLPGPRPTLALRRPPLLWALDPRLPASAPRSPACTPPARDPRPRPLLRRPRPTRTLPLPAGGRRPHLPGPGEDPLWQRSCHLQWLPGNHEGVQEPEVPAGPLPRGTSQGTPWAAVGLSGVGATTPR